MAKAQYNEPSEYRVFDGERYHRVYEAPLHRQGEVRRAAEKMRKDGVLVRVVLLRGACVAYGRIPIKLHSRRRKQKKDMKSVGVEGWRIDVHGNDVVLWGHRTYNNRSVMLAKETGGRKGYKLTITPGDTSWHFQRQSDALAAAKSHMEHHRRR